jgi:hypothetical protein
VLLKLTYALLVLATLLGVAGCIWAIQMRREPLAVALGGVALLTFVATWLIGLRSAFRAE